MLAAFRVVKPLAVLLIAAGADTKTRGSAGQRAAAYARKHQGQAAMARFEAAQADSSPSHGKPADLADSRKD